MDRKHNRGLLVIAVFKLGKGMLLLIIALIICVPLFLIVIGIPLLIISVGVLFIWHVIAAIIGAVRAGEGELYYYPLTIRFLK